MAPDGDALGCRAQCRSFPVSLRRRHLHRAPPPPRQPWEGRRGGGEAASSPGLPDGLPGVREAARTGAWEMSASKTLPMVSSETWAKDRSSSASLVTFPITSFTFTAGKQ